VLEEAVARGLPIPVGEDVEETPGKGIEGTIDGRRWRVRRGGPDRVVVEGDEGEVFWIVLEDRPRPDAARDLAALAAQGRTVLLLTGDHAQVARRVASEVGVDAVVADADPTAKLDRIQQLRHAGHKVLFVGDGLNDGPALSAADVGVAMASGAASSVLVADGILAGDRLAPLAAGLAAAPVVRRRIRAAAVRSVVYNVLAVSAAVLGWINPLVAAVLMPLSSGLVLASAAGVERGVRRALGGS
jgi:P-type E1-E2 ATPase